ncbi:hypothetical protein ACF05L_38680 [Streptomyces bobili]|uniref:hypothetical protein n=1 Tax=Streptomyces bobili TaxID=67280 RepID=UPI0036FD5983
MDPNRRLPSTGRQRLTVIWTWAARRRRTALAHILRGACYGIGTGTIGLAFIWVEQCL